MRFILREKHCSVDTAKLNVVIKKNGVAGWVVPGPTTYF